MAGSGSFRFCVLDFPIYSILLNLRFYSIKLLYFWMLLVCSNFTVVVPWEREKALTSSRARQVLSSAWEWELVGLLLALLARLRCFWGFRCVDELEVIYT